MADGPNLYQAPSDAAQSSALFPSTDDDDTFVMAAGFGIRAAARLIDTVFGLVLGLVAGMAVGVVGVALAASGSLTPGWQARLGQLSAASLAFALLGPILYHGVAEGMGGATIGKAILGLRVRREDMSPAGVGGALVRSLAYFIDALFCGLVAYWVMSDSRWQQRLGDRWGKTIVMKASDIKPKFGPQPGIAGGILLGTFLWVVVLFVGNLSKLFS